MTLPGFQLDSVVKIGVSTTLPGSSVDLLLTFAVSPETWRACIVSSITFKWWAKREQMPRPRLFTFYLQQCRVNLEVLQRRIKTSVASFKNNYFHRANEAMRFNHWILLTTRRVIFGTSILVPFKSVAPGTHCFGKKRRSCWRTFKIWSCLLQNFPVNFANGMHDFVVSKLFEKAVSPAQLACTIFLPGTV